MAVRSVKKCAIIGLGGGGCNMISTIAEQIINREDISLIYINTDLQSLEDTNTNIEELGIPQDRHKSISFGDGDGAGASVDVAKEWINGNEDLKKSILESIEGVDLVFFVSGLGGGTGSASSEIVKIIKEDVDLVISMVTMPFEYERQKFDIADEALKELKAVSNGVLSLDNQKIIDVLIDEEAGARDSYALPNVTVTNCIFSIIKILNDSSRGSVNIDFNDLKSILNYRGESLIGVGKSKLPNELTIENAKPIIEETIAQATENQLIKTSDKISEGKGFLIHLSMPSDFPYKAMNLAINNISTKILQNADFVIHGNHFTEDNNEETNSRYLTVTIIATGIEDSLSDIKIIKKESSIDNNNNNNSEKKQTPYPRMDDLTEKKYSQGLEDFEDYSSVIDHSGLLDKSVILDNKRKKSIFNPLSWF
jgi:cell division protein FtsZ